MECSFVAMELILPSPITTEKALCCPAVSCRTVGAREYPHIIATEKELKYAGYWSRSFSPWRLRYPWWAEGGKYGSNYPFGAYPPKILLADQLFKAVYLTL
jgi:hypothetical protein